jgi:Zn-finger protein
LSFFNAPKHIKYIKIKEKDKYHKKDREYKYCGISLYSEELVKDYLSVLNVGDKKAKRLMLPEFNNYELNLSWLLGYYDGDGYEKCARLYSSSLKLLEQIKERHNIDFDIKTCRNNMYSLYLGENFREKLCANYKFSLERKRTKIFGKPYRDKNKNLDILTKEILTSLVKTHSLEEIGKMFGFDRVSVYAKAKREKIEIPKRKGGRKYKNGKNIKEGCKYYPCHKEIGTCAFCYCPLYYLECNGNFKILDNGVKDCSECLIPHKEDNYDYIVETLKKEILRKKI